MAKRKLWGATHDTPVDLGAQLKARIEAFQAELNAFIDSRAEAMKAKPPVFPLASCAIA